MSQNQSGTVQGLQDFSTNTSEYNQQRFFVDSIIRETINTAIPVLVDGSSAPGASGAAGTVSATPLVAQTDAQGNALPMSEIPRMPFQRIQGGCAALIIDPVPGDIGLAVFCKQDISGLTPGMTAPVTPRSWRNFDQSDGVFLPGIQNQPPTVWIEIAQNNTVTIHAPAGVTIETEQSCTINAGQAVNITAPVINLNGALNAQGQNGGSTTATFTGTLNASEDVTASGISLNSHTHGGVETGGGSTGGPQ